MLTQTAYARRDWLPVQIKERAIAALTLLDPLSAFADAGFSLCFYKLT